MTEAETRIFQAMDDRSAQTQYLDPRPTGPGYIAPKETGYPQSVTPQESEPSRVKRHGLLWASAILVVLLFLFAGALALRWSRASTSPTSTTKIEVPPEAGIPPPVVPQPPQPPTITKGTGSDLVYPGAEIMMEMTRGAEGSVRTLRTKDSVEKVIAWYTTKLKPEKIIKTEESVVLSGTVATAIISSDDGETNVVLKEGIDR